MPSVNKPADLATQLQQFDVFQAVPLHALQWMVDHAELVRYDKGKELFYPDMPVNHMQVIVSGSYVVRIDRGGQSRELGVWGAGYITGVLPFSRMVTARASGVALETCLVLELHREHFIEMVNVCYDLVQALVAVMTSRVRDFTQQRFHEEKLMSLGKLSAGLAHELNNPAAAIVRSSEELYKRIHATPEKFKDIITMRITPEQTDRVNEILFAKIRRPETLQLSILERENCYDDILDWLEDHGINQADDIAETFTDFGLVADDLNHINALVEGHSLAPLMWWLESVLSLERLVAEIREAAGRISGLVSAVKDYSHMDRATSKEKLDVREGINSTLMIMRHKLKSKQIQEVKALDDNLPTIEGYASELNQVWTNLIANAVDAMPSGGVLTVRAFRDRHQVCVSVHDTGEGISEENITRIFDPFFSTKSSKEGTGMGLDIVKRIIDRHDGEIKVTSQPGDTTFHMCFPVVE